MNIPKTALTTLLASTPVLAEDAIKIAPDIQPSTVSVELCQEVVRRMFLSGAWTKLELNGQGDAKAPEVMDIEQKRFSVQGAADGIVKCQLNSIQLADLFVPSPLADGKGLAALYIEESYAADPAPTGIEDDGLRPPYQFVDFTGADGKPDGIFDNVCDRRVCKPARYYKPDQRRALQQRFDSLVRTTLKQYRDPREIIKSIRLPIF